MAAVCRVCLGKASHPHYTSLFSKLSLEKDLPRRVSKVSGISMCQENGYPTRVCRSCMETFYSLEKGLDKFREKAMNSYMAYSRKRPTESRQSPSTPSTERSRLPAKRSRARCLFPDASRCHLIHNLS